MNKAATIAAGLAAGSMTYFLAPERRRRAARRARELASTAKSALSQEIPDRVLEERVCRIVERSVDYPEAIHVHVSRGRVTLRGDALASDVGDLIGKITDMRGVDAVEDRLDVYRSAQGVPELERARARGGWSSALRLIAGATGGTLAAYGLSHCRLVLGKAASAVGFGLLTEGVGNRRLQQALKFARRAA